MSELNIILKAKNSNGEHSLIFMRQDDWGEEYFPTLVGEYKGDAIQIDFDPLSLADLEELILSLELLKEEKAVKGE